jgi:hypothetical protein
MTMDARDQLISTVLDRLLPPNQELPGAGSMGLGAKVEEEARLVPANGAALEQILSQLPADFTRQSSEAQDEALLQVEQAAPQVFFALIVMAYNAYYTDERVLKLIEQETGYAARPPQPLGYELKPFDENLLAKVRQREPFYRKV